MGRPRKSIWESPDELLRIREAKGGYLLTDTRGVKPIEIARKDLGVLVAIAEQRAELAVPTEQEMTFYDLAIEYIREGMPVRENNERACSSGWFEDNRGRIRNHFSHVGMTKLSDLPDDFIEKAALKVRRRPKHNSLSLENKVIGIGRKVIAYGKHTGKIAKDRDFPGPTQVRVERKINRDDTTLTVQHHNLPSHASVHKFARQFAVQRNAPYMKLFWWLAFYIGFRQGELCALEASDIQERHGRLIIEVVKKVIIDATTKELIVEHYAKGYKHRDVVVPRLLEGPVRNRVAEVSSSGSTLMFPSWKVGQSDRHIRYDSLKNGFISTGEQIGWEVRTNREPEKYTLANGEIRTLTTSRTSTLIYTIHNARAFAATAMHVPRRGISLRGMGMRVSKVAEQLGDTEEVVRAHYLGIIDDEFSLLDRDVL